MCNQRSSRNGHYPGLSGSPFLLFCALVLWGILLSPGALPWFSSSGARGCFGPARRHLSSLCRHSAKTKLCHRNGETKYGLNPRSPFPSHSPHPPHPDFSHHRLVLFFSFTHMKSQSTGSFVSCLVTWVRPSDFATDCCGSFSLLCSSGWCEYTSQFLHSPVQVHLTGFQFGGYYT